MGNLFVQIEKGKQRGATRSIEIDGHMYWCSAGIQKHNKTYKAHVSVIREDNMASENYDVLFTRSFSDLKKAIDCVNSNGHIRFDEFSVVKGQKIFNPEFDEENEY